MSLHRRRALDLQAYDLVGRAEVDEMWEWHDGPSGWGWFWMAVMMALVWLPLLLAGAWLLTGFGGRGLRGSADGQREDLDARELARRAYARGEIDRERFLQMMADLDASERPRHVI